MRRKKRLFLSAAQPTDQGEESIVLGVVVFVGGLVLESPMHIQTGCIQKILFLIMGTFRKKKTFFKMNTEFRKRFILFFKVIKASLLM